MDVWVNFTHATKWQAEGIFKCFFPYKPAGSSPPAVSTSGSTSSADSSVKNVPGLKKKSVHAIPLLSEEEISDLAKKFAESIPEDELSVGVFAFFKRCIKFDTISTFRSRVSRVTYSRTRHAHESV